MDVEQSVLAPCMEQAQVALASLMAVLQMALASLIDLVVSDSFWQIPMPRSQTNFCQQMLMDDVVASSSPRALLASFWRCEASSTGVLQLGPGVLAMGKGAAGISSREATPMSASSRALTWEDVSTGPERSPNLGGRGVSMTMGFSLFGVESPDACPDMSNTACDRSSLTSIVILTCLSAFCRGALMGLGT